MLKTYHIRIGLVLGAVVLSMSLAACNNKSDKQKASKVTTAVAKLRSLTVHLPYAGTLKPLSTISLLSPVDGRVTKVNFSYGQYVKKGQVIAILNSKQLSDNFHKNIASFLQAKSSYNNEVINFAGSQALYKAGVIQRSTFLSNQSNYQTKAFSFYQTKFQLEKVLREARIDPKSVEKLNLGDTKAVDKLLAERFTHIVVKATGAGVALFPIPGQSNNSGDGNNSNSTGKLMPGTQVKQGELMLSIGDLTGLSASLQVSEINVNRIRPGMPVTVTGDGFPGITLHGEIKSVASQASPNQGGSGVSMFNVAVIIPKITEAQRKIIHVGMTCKIDIAIKEKPQVMIPLKALQRKNGLPMVTMVAASGERKTVQVLTGTTTPDGYVAIVSGIKVGDKVLVHD